MAVAQSIDEAKLQAFVGKVLDDFDGALDAALAAIGDKLGLSRAMAGAGPLSPAERTGTTERHVHEWLLSQATGGYVDYDSASGRYSLSPEHAAALTDETIMRGS